jgi:hypothetical protein
MCSAAGRPQASGDVVHRGHDQVGVAERGGVVGRCQGQNGHAGAFGGQDACRCVFDNDTFDGRDGEFVGAAQVRFGMKSRVQFRERTTCPP